MFNRAILIGRLTADPELKQTQSGISVCSFSIAVDRRFSGRDSERKTDFINITSAGRIRLPLLPQGRCHRGGGFYPDPQLRGQKRQQAHRHRDRDR